MMKRTLFTWLCLCLSLGALAAQKHVTISKPGTLSSLIGKQQPTTLILEGDLNKDDARFLQQLGKILHTLDLSKATFDGSGTLPAGLFKGSSLKKVVLPQNVSLQDSVFAFSPNLTTVVFPHDAVELMQGVFEGCPKIKSLTIHNIQYICYKAFRNIPNLKTLTLDGILGHADGWFCSQLPSLKKIVFSGFVASTGGKPMADNCPELSEVIFSANALMVHFGSVENCPKLKQCTVTGTVLNSSNDEFLPHVKDMSTVDAKTWDRFKACLNQLEQQGVVKSKYYNLGTDYYNLACAYSQMGQTDKAIDALRRAARNGYHHVKWMTQDKDLKPLHGNAAYESLMDSLKQEYDNLTVLKNAKCYQTGSMGKEPRFTYEDYNSKNMTAIRDYFKLDSVLSQDDEIQKFKTLMHFVHDAIRHDGSGGFPLNTPRNAIDLYKACSNGKGTLNCRGLAIVLSELYMAYGWPARVVTCLPRRYDTDNDCHVIVAVWSRTLNKWVWMDPTFDAFITDGKGLLLNQQEVRERMRQGKYWEINKDANWNHLNQETQENYADYMAKNLYFLQCTLKNGYESDTYESKYYTLSPTDEAYRHSDNVYDDEWFWQDPK